MDIEKFAAEVRGSGGASVNMAGQSPVTGYMVGLAGSQIALPLDDFDDGAVAEYLGLYGPLLHVGANTYLGGWVLGDLVYLDVAAQFTDREEAIAAGQKAGQIAIYDVEAGEDIYLR